MATDFTTGAAYSTTFSQGARAYYEQVLMETLRANNIFVQFCTPKEDFRARDTSQIVFSEVMDTSPNWNSIAESTMWLEGEHMDSRQITITLEQHGAVMKFHDYTELTNFWKNGDYTGLVAGKLGRNMVDYLDRLAMNAFLSAPNVQYAGSATSRFGLTATDLYDPDYGELARVHLEELYIPGVQGVGDGESQTVMAITSPRVIYDIRQKSASATKWWEVVKYANPEIAMRFEAGAWGGVRYLRTPKLRLRNFGKVSNQTTLSAATVVGQGSAATVDGFSVGQSGSTRYVSVTDSSGFSVGQTVTIHSASVYDDDGSGGKAPKLADGTQENAVISAIDSGGSNRLTFTKPLMKPHASGAYVTKGVDLSPTIVLGGPPVVYAVGERPNVVVPPKYDDLQRINRIGWRGFLKFQMFRPEWLEVIWSGISTA